MRELTNIDLWYAAHELRANALCITTNGYVNRQGEAVMGRGVALKAKSLHYPGIEDKLGALIRQKGNTVQVIDYQSEEDGLRGVIAVVAFPVKHHWKEQASLGLIYQSAIMLDRLTTMCGWSCVVLPRPGCGNGQRKWEEVRPLVQWMDDRFVFVTNEPSGEEVGGGDRLKGEGITRVKGNTPDWWKTLFLTVAKTKLKEGPISPEMITSIIGQPPNHPHAVGSVMNSVVRQLGLARVTNVKALRDNQHSALIGLWTYEESADDD